MKKMKSMVLALVSLVGCRSRGETMLLANEKTAKPADYWKRKTAMAIGKPEMAESSDDDLEKAHDQHMASLANEMSGMGGADAQIANEKETAAKKKGAEGADEYDEVKLANERVAALEKEQADMLIGAALSTGRILPAAKTDWEGRFANDFEAAKGELAKETRKLKTDPKSKDAGKGNQMHLANEAARGGRLHSLVNAEMQKNGGNYDLAFAAIQSEHPDLFAQMKQPAPATK